MECGGNGILLGPIGMVNWFDEVTNKQIEPKVYLYESNSCPILNTLNSTV